MTEWLRPVFGRAKTPLQPAASSDRPASIDDGPESEEGSSVRPRPASRVSSYIGLRVNTPSVPESDTFPNFRKPDSVYHAPSGDQMAEILQAAMMGQSSFSPLAVEYNSCILHVLEAYWAMRMEISKKGEEIEVMRRQHAETIKEFEETAVEWEAKEQNYQTELKNLEVLLGNTEGVEKVSLARSKSTVHGSQQIKDIVRDLKSMKQRDTEMTKDSSTPTDNASDRLQHPQGRHKRSEALDRNRRLGKPPIPIDDSTTTDYQRAPVRNPVFDPPGVPASEVELRQHRENLMACCSSNPSLRETQSYHDNLEKQPTSESECDSDASSNEMVGMETGDRGRAIEASSALRRAIWGVEDKAKPSMRHSSIVPSQMGFSFNMGDDLSILGQGADVQNKMPRKGSKRTTSKHNPHAEAKNSSSSIPTLMPKHAGDPVSTERNAHEDRTLNRFNPASSVLTAFRAESDRNSSDGSVGSHKHIAEKNSSSSEAVTAAIRAVTQSSTRILSGRQHTSSEASIERRKPSPSQRSE